MSSQPAASDVTLIAPSAHTQGRFRGWMILAAFAAVFIVQSFVLRHFTIDDIGISYRYALHLAEGKGLVWNLDGPRVEGFSNLLWVLMLALVRLFGFEILTASKFLSAALGLINLWVLWLICRHLWKDHAYWWLPVLLVAATPEWSAWSVSGLEIAMVGTFLLLLILGMCRHGAAGTLLLTIGAVGLTLTRPEGAALAAVALLIAWVGERPRGPYEHWTVRMVPAASLILTAAGLMAFRLAYYGYPFPNTVYAKFETTLPSAGHVLRWIVLTAPLLAGHAMAWRSRTPATGVWIMRGALILTVLQMLIVLPVHPVMNVLHRYLIAFLPLLALSAPVLTTRMSSRTRWGGAIAAAVLVVWTLQGWPAVAEKTRREAYMFDRTRCVADKLLRLPGRPTVGLQDAGRIPYWTDLPAYDAWGLCDLELAHRGFSLESILEKRPDVYVMSARFTAEGHFKPYLGMDGMLMQMPAFAEQYGLWSFCPGTGDTSYMTYDYAIFVQADWARSHGFEIGK